MSDLKKSIDRKVEELSQKIGETECWQARKVIELRHYIANSDVDDSYCGNDDIWGFPAVAIRHTEIPKGTRICQFRLVKQDEPVEFEQVEDLGNPNRGGWGSTGTGKGAQ